MQYTLLYYIKINYLVENSLHLNTAQNSTW